MAEFNVNNSLNNRGNIPAPQTNFDSLLNLARGVIDNISQQVRNLVTELNFNTNNVTQDQTGGFRIQLPQLSNLVSGQQDILLKTSFPLDKTQNFNLQIQNSNVVLNQGQPVLRLEGQILQNDIQANNPQTQKFTVEISLSSLNNQNSQNIGQLNNISNADQVVRNFLPSNNVNAFTNNLSENLRPLLPQNIQNINLVSQNNLSIQINSITTPTGEQINLGNNNLNNLQNTIGGQIEIFSDANEALLRTEFGTFRISNLSNLPNGSNISFTITGQAATAQNQQQENILNLNPNNLQTLRLALESPDSPLQNLLKNLISAQNISTLAQRFFPNPDDRAAYARHLIFLSAAAKGAPEGWLGDEGQLLINNIHESDTNLGRLQEVFGILRNFSGHGQQQINLDWNSYIVPFYDGNKLSFVTIQVQKDPEGELAKNFKGKRKFILELEQDDLGRVAIEGLYSNNQGKVNNMDIVLKTENTVDDEFMKELTAIFNETATAYNFTGSLTFAPFTTPTPIYTDISKILGDGIVI